MKIKNQYDVRPITRPPKFHFKQYYDMQPWDYSGRLFLAMETDFQDRPPQADDPLTLGLVDLTDCSFHPLARTRAWNFQQGCMPHWQHSSPAAGRIVYNDIVEGAARAIVLDINNGSKRVYSRPIQALAPDGERAAGLNFARWAKWRPGYGYAGIVDPFEEQNQPHEDAVHRIDFADGRTTAMVTQEQLMELFPPDDPRRGSPSWFCHLMFSPDGKRLAGLMRFWSPQLVEQVHARRTDQRVNVDGAVPARRHCMWMVNTDGTGLKVLVLDGLVSHADWRDPGHLLFWGSMRIEDAPAYVLLNVESGETSVIGAHALREDGHMSYHADKRWFVTDTYPDPEHMRTLKLFDTATETETVLGRFYAPPELDGELRCDLHPCWSRDYERLAIDSIHAGGKRQIYIVEIGDPGTPRQSLVHMTR